MFWLSRKDKKWLPGILVAIYFDKCKTTKVASSNHVHAKVYSIQHYVIVCQWFVTGRWFSPGTWSLLGLTKLGGVVNPAMFKLGHFVIFSFLFIDKVFIIEMLLQSNQKKSLMMSRQMNLCIPKLKWRTTEGAVKFVHHKSTKYSSCTSFTDVQQKSFLGKRLKGDGRNSRIYEREKTSDHHIKNFFDVACPCIAGVGRHFIYFFKHHSRKEIKW